MKPYKKPLLTASLLLAFLFLFAHSPLKAAATNNPLFATLTEVQQMITTALSPIQSNIQGLTTRASNLEATVTPIPGQISNIQATITPIPGQIADLQASQASQASLLNSLQANIQTLQNVASSSPDFQVTNITNVSQKDGSSEWHPSLHFDVTWNNQQIPDFSVRGIWHTTEGDLPFTDTGNYVTYPASFLAPSPITIPLEFYIFWQGTTKHVTTSVTVPH